MGDKQKVHPPEQLPLTGVGEHLDQMLSSIFVEPFANNMKPGVQYGTRSQTIIAVWQDGCVQVRERSIQNVDAGNWQELQHEFELPSEVRDRLQQEPTVPDGSSISAAETTSVTREEL